MSKVERRKHEYRIWKDAGNGYSYARCWCGGTATVATSQVKAASKRHDDAVVVVEQLREDT